MPLSRTHVVHPLFQNHHQRTVLGQMTAACVIWRPAPANAPKGFDELAGRSILAKPTPIWAGPCRLQISAARGIGTANPVVGDTQIPVAAYTLIVPIGAAPPSDETVPYVAVPLIKINDLVEMTVCDDDPALITGAPSLVVTAVPRGSIVWQQTLSCDLYPPTVR